MYLLRNGTIPVTIYTGEHQVCPQQAGQSPRASTAEQGQHQQRDKWKKDHESSALHRELQATKDADSRRDSPPQGRAHQLVIQYPMASPENIHASSSTQTEQVIFRNQHFT